MRIFRFSSLFSVLSLSAAVASLEAEVKLPAIFGDHMVLQQGMTLPVWGTADPGEAVTVTVGKESGKATADTAGKWRVNLEPLGAEATPLTVTVAGASNTVTFTDVLVGEVWVCSGQSNMALNLLRGGAGHPGTKISEIEDPQLRLFVVARRMALEPLAEVTGKWEVCSGKTAENFSAAGYFFGRELRKTLKRPVGLIGTYFGGTPAEAWTSLSGLKNRPEFGDDVAEYEKTKTNFAKATEEYPAKVKAQKAALAAWQQSPEGLAYQAKVKENVIATKKAIAEGKAPPSSLRLPASAPHEPVPPDGGKKMATTLFNGMVAPLIPYAIKGVIWYQGENNSNHAAKYRTLFPNMITDWRTKWGEGDFPFLFVQLANFNASEIPNWPFLREAQLKTLSLPKTAMATAIDIGVPNNIHPGDKEDVGVRLSLAARHVAYGEKLVYSGPIYQAMKVDGSAISLTFTQGGSGLVIGEAPWVPAGFKALPKDKLVGFVLAGEDRKWVPAEAKIVDGKVVVSSAEVPKPVAVRYDWANNAQGNLYNKEGLPASSFRTDDWGDPVAEGLVRPKKGKAPVDAPEAN